ncbi:hypothetical protein GOARA_013_00180 [Gordonia araii NBRC 100433]|uniref:Uncharacterized protein n=1 Tax=Gordonia araii NBRC 100433 TaxID=1073574 RepID=G7GY99_9ACTN|nr:hypothetical protein [Gordonia araii]NNG97428.1 hypothetical protein [Gordonia araii NBRC 100433]GAB08574.1 hypothetical protein GOARA_013_00180 [Gordonia araii NBRC 100433]
MSALHIAVVDPAGVDDFDWPAFRDRCGDGFTGVVVIDGKSARAILSGMRAAQAPVNLTLPPMQPGGLDDGVGLRRDLLHMIGATSASATAISVYGTAATRDHLNDLKSLPDTTVSFINGSGSVAPAASKPTANKTVSTSGSNADRPNTPRPGARPKSTRPSTPVTVKSNTNYRTTVGPNKGAAAKSGAKRTSGKKRRTTSSSTAKAQASASSSTGLLPPGFSMVLPLSGGLALFSGIVRAITICPFVGMFGADAPHGVASAAFFVAAILLIPMLVRLIDDIFGLYRKLSVYSLFVGGLAALLAPIGFITEWMANHDPGWGAGLPSAFTAPFGWFAAPGQWLASTAPSWLFWIIYVICLLAFWTVSLYTVEDDA